MVEPDASGKLELPLELNIAQRFLVDRLEGQADRVAILHEGQSYTYRAVDQLTNRYSHALAELGVQQEQRVVVAVPDSPAFVAALFGALKLGAVGVMVNGALPSEQLGYFLRYTRARVAVVHADQLQAFVEAAAGARELRALLVVGGAEAKANPVRVVPFEAERYSEVAEVYPTHRDDPALWLFSGGTTGRPKGVVQSHRSFATTTVLYGQRVLGVREGDITLSVPKLYFGYATGSNLFFPFSVGATTILFGERCTADTLFDLIERHRPTIFINVPTMIGKLLASERAETTDLSSLRLCTSAGEALPAELFDRFTARFGVPLLDGLGTAEMWHVFVTNRIGDIKLGSLGRVVDGFEVQVRDDAGNQLPHGEVGWLWVRGDARALGYWHEQTKSRAAFVGEWYVSGDMIHMDEEGYVYYSGRGDDMLKVSGKWLSPSEVENCLLAHDWVKECAVVGVPDVEGLTKPHAFVLPTEDAGPIERLLDDLGRHLNELLEHYKRPRQIHVREELPRTHLGKIDRGKLRELATN